MGKLEWSDSLCVDESLIDEQHKTWIQKLNDVSVAIEAHQGPTRIAEALEFLNEYTSFHFSTEERYMAKYAYPDSAEHLKKHADLKKALADLELEYEEEGATHLLAQSIDFFAVNWLVNHITETDVKLGVYFRSKGIALTDKM
ncbi:MAG: hemerythrin family protein [Candidatus Hydrogenedentes bacterium]|nr:hemerythrin family protein [Candidatus Hydrogenedentota bacterium]